MNIWKAGISLNQQIQVEVKELEQLREMRGEIPRMFLLGEKRLVPISE